MKNIPDVKLGIIAVSRDCFPVALSEMRRAAIKKAYGDELYECMVTVENELDMRWWFSWAISAPKPRKP